MIRKLKVGKEIVGLLIDASDVEHGVHPISDPAYPLQVLVMRRKAGHVIDKHVHKKMDRTVSTRQKAVVVIKGAMAITVCNLAGADGETCIVEAGQCFFLIHGGYRIEMKDDCLFIEFKNGPHIEDKITFS